MTHSTQLPHFLDRQRSFELFDDFTPFTDTKPFTETGTNAQLADAFGGVLEMKTAASDNGVAFIASPKLFTLNPYLAIVAACRFRWADADSPAANIYFGLTADGTATEMGDDGAGPQVAVNSAMLYTVDGSTVWSAQTTVDEAGTVGVQTLQDDSLQVAAPFGGQNKAVALTSDRQNGWITLEITIRARQASPADMQFAYSVDPQGSNAVKQLVGADNRLIEHVAKTPAAEGALALVFGVKAGSATEQVVELDWIGASQERNIRAGRLT